MARLILKSAVFAEGDIELSESDLPVTLGRSLRADITIHDLMLSRIHAEICHGEEFLYAGKDFGVPKALRGGR